MGEEELIHDFTMCATSVIVVILATYCRLQHSKNSLCVAASLSYPDIIKMLLIRRHFVVQTCCHHFSRYALHYWDLL